METTITNHFAPFDYIVVAVTLVASLGIGLYFSLNKAQKTTEYLLAGGRNNSTFQGAASILATTVSAVTILGFPAEIYSYGVQIFQITLMGILFMPISAFVFVPFLYPMRLVSVYEYLEKRFDSIAVRWIGSFTFILQQVLLSGLTLYAPSIALEAFLGIPKWVSIVGMGLCGTVYTSFGGLKAVLATDTFQVIIMFFGMGAIAVKGFMVAGGVSSAFSTAEKDGRLNLFDFTFDPFMRHNFFNFLLGFAVQSSLTPGTRQHEVQRYSSMPTLSAAKNSILFSIPMKALTLGVSCLTGIALYAAHAGCDPVKSGKIVKTEQLVTEFVKTELQGIPGMLGLFTSCVICGVLSSYSSALNGLVAVTWTDFLSKLPVLQKIQESAKARISMGIGVMYGLLTVTLAFLSDKMGDNIYAASYAVTGPPAGVMGAAFIMALFMPFVRKQGALCGMCIGLATSMFVVFQALGNPKTPPLPTSTANCFSNMTQEYILPEYQPLPELEWPRKFYTLSYVLYPAFAAAVTIFIGVLISLLMKPFSNEHEVDPKYIHPFVRRKQDKVPKSYSISNGNSNL